jgi:hypothetical protein
LVVEYPEEEKCRRRSNRRLRSGRKSFWLHRQRKTETETQRFSNCRKR